MKFLVVHGEKPTRKLTIHRAFVARLDAAARIANQEKFDAIILTGGCTRKGAISEAQMGSDYLSKRVSTRLMLECEARSTSENIRNVRRILADENIGFLTVISSKKRIWRLKYLYHRLWKDMSGKISFASAPDFYWWPYYLAEAFYFLFAFLDPEEKLFARVTKKLFRNAAR